MLQHSRPSDLDFSWKMQHRAAAVTLSQQPAASSPQPHSTFNIQLEQEVRRYCCCLSGRWWDASLRFIWHLHRMHTDAVCWCCCCCCSGICNCSRFCGKFICIGFGSWPLDCNNRAKVAKSKKQKKNKTPNKKLAHFSYGGRRGLSEPNFRVSWGPKLYELHLLQLMTS